MSSRDLQFLSGRFRDAELPPEKQYLFRYFTTEIQRYFVRYYLTFGEFTNFTDHTGFACSRRWMEILRDRILALEEAKREARKNIDLERLAEIESGRYKL